MAASVLRKRINTAAGLLLLAGLGYVAWPFVVGRSQMQNFCAALPLGASLSHVSAEAAAQGYKVSSPLNGLAFVHEPRSMGRFNCVLHFDGNDLASAAYEDNP